MAEACAKYGWYGDDFTGATDTLATLAEAGQRAMLFMGVPRPEHLEAAGPLDAIGIAGAARSMSPEAMADELAPVGRFFAGQGVRVLHYKCCSTFDSAPEIGSIGAAVRILRAHFPGPLVPVIGGQPNIRRYCLFSTLYAAAGIGGDVHRIDRHPTMSAHPVTPMAEADLRRHLAMQGLEEMAAIHYPAYAEGEAALDALMAAFHAQKRGSVLLDIAEEAHLAPAGRLIWKEAQNVRLVAVGGSSVAQALTAHWHGGEVLAIAPAPLAPADGAVFVLAGSLSPVTRRQIEQAHGFARLTADARLLTRDADYAREMVAQLAPQLTEGSHVLLSTAPPVPAAADSAAPARVAAVCASLLRDLLRAVPVRRLGIAGGDTSSHAVRALGLWGLSYVTTLGAGVAICRAHSDDPALDGMELMLKGGQMGADDLFTHLVQGSQA
jgi:3-oxoisoapionate kinase